MNQRYIKPVGGGVTAGNKLGHSLFEQIVSLENLLLAWREFRRGKGRKLDVQLFEFNLEDNLFKIHHELMVEVYTNEPYVSFYITDPKLRHIHKASVRDRVVHQAIFRILYPVFDTSFVYDSYSCRLNKGTHRAVLRLESFLRKISQNATKPVWALKCDIKKFFDSIDKEVLLGLIQKKIIDTKLLNLIGLLLDSFETRPGKGLPLGNVTSQLLCNVYLNELDQFAKHRLRLTYYVRYCDDFIIIARDREYLRGLIPKLAQFLHNALKLELHEKKIIIKKYNQGIDFLGYVSLPHYRVLRTKTKRRMMRKLRCRMLGFKQGNINESSLQQSFRSYLGILQHCHGYKIGLAVQRVLRFMDGK